jgi:hypothetical protein
METLRGNLPLCGPQVTAKSGLRRGGDDAEW